MLCCILFTDLRWNSPLKPHIYSNLFWIEVMGLHCAVGTFIPKNFSSIKMRKQLSLLSIFQWIHFYLKKAFYRDTCNDLYLFLSKPSFLLSFRSAAQTLRSTEQIRLRLRFYVEGICPLSGYFLCSMYKIDLQGTAFMSYRRTGAIQEKISAS